MPDIARNKYRRYWIAAAILVCAGVVLLVIYLQRPWKQQSEDQHAFSVKTFDGPSTSLDHTIIVPTLDTPVPKDKSAIWCASFQLAWDRLKNDVAKGPVKIENAQAVADRLNAAEFPEKSLDLESYYAAAGLAKDGIVKKILDDMARRFPEGPTPELREATEGVVAYGYLKAGVNYPIPYFDNDEAFEFTDSEGNSTCVKSFGIRKKDDDAYRSMRQQVSVLHVARAASTNRSLYEFILDPCKTSQPYQIVLARVERKATLAETIADVEKRIKDAPAELPYQQLHLTDKLLVPTMHWNIAHRFKELEGKDKMLLNPSLTGLYIDTALQTINSRLDRGGAEVASEAKILAKSGGWRHFEFNHPFLIVMKKRGESQPFFVMWVDNAELMQRW
jgi:hypothetical protein